MTVRHLMQPTDSTCFQTCIAMLLGHDTVDHVLREIPHRRSGTRAKPAIEYMRKHGAKCDDRFRPIRYGCTEIAIVRIVWRNGKGHVVLKNGRTWHDPQLPEPFAGILPPNREWSADGRVTSYLAVSR